MDAEKIAEGLSEAQRRAIGESWKSSWGDYYIRAGTRHDVRRRLVETGLLGKRPGNPLIKLGLAVRDILRGK